MSFLPALPTISRLTTRSALPPPELVTALGRQSCERLEWRAVPSMCDRRQRPAPVEIDAVLSELLDDRRLERTLRTIDLLDGCANQCDTCLADSPRPTKMISLRSLERLFDDPRFVEMLQPDSLRFGSFGDLLNHPDALRIASLALDATRPLDSRRRTISSNLRAHTVKIYTNYRPATEDRLDALLSLVDDARGRLVLMVSLPLNRTEEINRKFLEYAKSRNRYFRLGQDCDDYPSIRGSICFGGPPVGVWDVGNPEWLLMAGRVLAPEYLKGRVHPSRRISRFRALEAEQRGFSKTYLNAEGLWLMVYATAYESHTSRVFTPLLPATLPLLSKIPYHPDFPTPPNWPGGSGAPRNYDEGMVCRLENAYKMAGQRKRSRIVIHAS